MKSARLPFQQRPRVAILGLWPGPLEHPSADQRRVSISNRYPVGLGIGDEPLPMDGFALDRAAVADSVEPAIGATVPNHVARVDRIR